MNYTFFAVALFAAATPSMAAPAETRISDRNISVTAFVDAGQVIHGSLVNGDGSNSQKVENLFLNRDGVALT